MGRPRKIVDGQRDDFPETEAEADSDWTPITDISELPKDGVMVRNGLNETLAVVIKSRTFKNHKWQPCETFRRAYDRGTLLFTPTEWRHKTRDDERAHGFV